MGRVGDGVSPDVDGCDNKRGGVVGLSAATAGGAAGCCGVEVAAVARDAPAADVGTGALVAADFATSGGNAVAVGGTPAPLAVVGSGAVGGFAPAAGCGAPVGGTAFGATSGAALVATGAGGSTGRIGWAGGGTAVATGAAVGATSAPPLAEKGVKVGADGDATFPTAGGTRATIVGGTPAEGLVACWALCAAGNALELAAPPS